MGDDQQVRPLGAPSLFDLASPVEASSDRPPTARLPGRRTSHVILLSIVTFGLYLLYYWWKVFREVDAASARRHYAKVYLAHLLLLALSVGLILAGAFPKATAQEGTSPASQQPSSIPALGGFGEGISFFRLEPATLVGGLAVLVLAAYQILELRGLALDREAMGLPHMSFGSLPLLTCLNGGAVLVSFPGDVLVRLLLGGLALLVLAEFNKQLNALWVARVASRSALGGP